jgi:hypothetical protein
MCVRNTRGCTHLLIRQSREMQLSVFIGVTPQTRVDSITSLRKRRR